MFSITKNGGRIQAFVAMITVISVHAIFFVYYSRGRLTAEGALLLLRSHRQCRQTDFRSGRDSRLHYN